MKPFRPSKRGRSVTNPGGYIYIYIYFGAPVPGHGRENSCGGRVKKRLRAHNSKTKMVFLGFREIKLQKN